jgi:hypothetical protein
MNKYKYTYFYLAITIEPIKDKYFSYILRVSDCNNIVSELKGINYLISANIMPTKKKAEQTVDFWNESYKKNSAYLLDDEDYLKNPTKYY